MLSAGVECGSNGDLQRRMKLAFVFPPIWPAQVDGSLQIWNREVTSRLAKNNDVVVYCGKFPSKQPNLVDGVRYREISTRLDDGIQKRYERIRRYLGVKRPLFSTDFWYIFYTYRIAIELRKQGCDLVHVYNYPQFARIIKRLNPKVSVVLNMHGEWLAQIPFSDIHKRLRDIDLIVSCSDFVTKSTVRKFPDIASRCKTVPMGVSNAFFESFSENLAQGHQPPASLRNLLYVGRISPEKGIHVLLDAFERICQKHPVARLTIVGHEAVAPREHIVDRSLGPRLADSLTPFYFESYLSQLEKRIAPEVAERIYFAGLVPYKEISKYYAQADVYISPSLYESFGMSVIEAMAAGLPVIATRAGAVPDFVKHRHNGLLVDVGDPTAIAEAFENLVADANLRTSIARIGRAEASQQYSWQRICSALVQHYRNVISDTYRQGPSEAPSNTAPVERV